MKTQRFLSTILACGPLIASALGQPVSVSHGRLSINEPSGRVEAWAVAPNVLRIDFLPTGVRPEPTPVLDPRGSRNARPVEQLPLVGSGWQGAFEGLATADMLFAVLRHDSQPGTLRITATKGGPALTISLAALSSGSLEVHHSADEHLYGMRGYSFRKSRDTRLDPSEGLFRDQGAPVAAGSQGDGGAPIAFTKDWGLLVDSVDGDFTTQGDALTFSHGSRKDIEAYIVIGPPKAFMRAVADLTGHPPMPPKWSLGFLNSQWGDDESVIRSQVAEYRQKQIPLDAYILDFDFKAWGEDNYGEFRWNSTSGPGNVGPDKFPNGANGKFCADLLNQGVHVVGIMKPRVLVTNTAGQPTDAAREGNVNHWFLPNEKPYEDYFSHRPSLDIDFSTPGARSWYWQHAKGLFDTGISGWWNDEADDGFPSLGFFQMQQSLYDGQRSASNQRVWSLNRNFYLGAQRYAFGTWSGDIRSGFPVMDQQAERMLATLDLGQPTWTMDGGGFGGHPSPENYARWMEFEALCPVMRVHGTYGERRQPWVYGPTAEAAAKGAIELRYNLLPTWYSLTREMHETGVGPVRPLFWEFPDDPGSANVTDEWMIGPGLLAAPVLEQGATVRHVYLPPGTWKDYWTDQVYQGGQTVDVRTDPASWSDIPLFQREGSIVATEHVRQFTGAPTQGQVVLTVWPGSKPSSLVLYDDDGSTYGYERGAYFSQAVTASRKGRGATVDIELSPRSGTGPTSVKSYFIRIPFSGSPPSGEVNGKSISFATVGNYCQFGVPAGKRLRIELHYSVF